MAPLDHFDIYRQTHSLILHLVALISLTHLPFLILYLFFIYYQLSFHVATFFHSTPLSSLLSPFLLCCHFLILLSFVFFPDSMYILYDSLFPSPLCSLHSVVAIYCTGPVSRVPCGADP